MWSRSRPPPRGPRCISADTRARTSSKNAQHARISVSSRSNASPDMACWSMLENANEIPQKSVEPVPGLLDRYSVRQVLITRATGRSGAYSTLREKLVAQRIETIDAGTLPALDLGD